MAIKNKFGLLFVVAAALALSACGQISGTPRGQFAYTGANLVMYQGSSFCLDKDALIQTPGGAGINVAKGSELVAGEVLTLNVISNTISANNFFVRDCTVAAPAAPTATVASKPAATQVVSPTLAATAVPSATAAAPAAPTADRPPFRTALPITGTSRTLSLDCKVNDRGAMVAAESGTITMYGATVTTTYSFGAPGDAGQRIENAAFVGCVDNLGVNTLVVKIGTPGQGTVNVLDANPTGGAARAKTDFYSMLSASNKNNCVPAPNAGCYNVNVWGFGTKPAMFDVVSDQSRWEAAEYVIPMLWK